ncbi:MAG: PD-(D/E)XK nuclease family protein [Candidatus Woesearchaeota archaeon]
MVYKLSPSSLSLLSECPRCFWLAHNRHARPSGIFPSLPSGMDKILKEHFDRYIGKGLPPELSSLHGIKLFDDLEKLNLWRNNRKGLQWEYEGNTLRGAIDNLLMGRKLIVLDYKTRGFPLKEDTSAHYQDQIDIYNFLLRKNGYETEDYAYLLFYHPSSVDSFGRVEFNTDLVKMTVDVSNAEKLFYKALKVLDGAMPPSAKECEWCKWREGG